MFFDSIVIGGGVAGVFTAYNLSKYSKTLLIEKKHIGAGGSGSAGAFLNPKFGNSTLSQLINKSMNFSREFYLNNSPEFIHLSKLNHYEDNGEHFIFDSAVADANEILQLFSKNFQIEYINISKNNISHDGDFWQIDKFKTKNLVFTTGALSELTGEPYIKIRPVWGERLDIESDTFLENSFHNEISISQTINGKIRIGATHFRDIIERESSNIEREEFLSKAKNIVELKNAKIVGSTSGVRSASYDFFPVIGRVIDSKKTIQKFPQLIHGRKYNFTDFEYYKNLFIFSGLGGYGFSLAPYFGELLANSILNNKFLDDEVEPHRLFKKYVKNLRNRFI